MQITLQTETLSSGLYIVAVPIGNLKDISLRALETLMSCSRILCEDTRVSQRLLQHYGIKASLYVYNDHSSQKDRAKVQGWIEKGESVALISDAGTPLISDPGFKLVRDLQEAGLLVETLPGASALTASLTLAGLPTDKVSFLGFLPPKQGARKQSLKAFSSIPHVTYVLYERGSRIADLAQDLLALYGDFELVIVREITKQYQEVIRINLTEILGDFEARGECVVLYHLPQKDYSEAELEELLAKRLQHGSLKEVVADLVEETGKPKREIYNLAVKVKDGR